MVSVRFADPSLAVPIDARKVINLTNSMPPLSEAEAQEWIDTFLLNFPNRTVINLSNRYRIGTPIIHSNDSKSGANSTTFVTVKQTRIAFISGTHTIRVYFEGRSNVFGSISAFRILRNLVVVHEMEVNTQSWVGFTKDIPLCSTGDDLIIQVRWVNTVTFGDAQNFRILGEHSPVLTLREAINVRTAGSPTPSSFTNLM